MYLIKNTLLFITASVLFGVSSFAKEKNCAQLLSSIFESRKVVSLKNFTKNTVPYDRLKSLINLEFKRKARKLKLSRKDVKRLSVSDKSKILLMMGTVFTQSAKGNFKKNTFEESIDQFKIDLFKKLKDKGIHIENINEIIFKYPQEEQEKIHKILIDLKMNNVNSKKDKLEKILLELFKDNGRAVYNSQLWNFLAMDLSSPVESAVKYYMNKALSNSNLGRSIQSRVKTIEKTIMNEIENTINRMP